MLAWTAWRALREFRRNERRTREELAVRNLARFRRLVRFVRARSPYYARVISEHGIDPRRARPEDFPPLTKTGLIEHFDEIATRTAVRRERIREFLGRSRDPEELYAGRFCVLHSSGTSGTVNYCAFTRREWLRGSLQFARLLEIGWNKRIAFVGATHGHFAGVSMAAARPWWASRLSYRTRVFDINDPLDSIVAGLNAFRPKVVVGYARALRILAQAQRAGELDIEPRFLVSGGEPLAPQDRAYVRDAFDRRVQNVYATTEHLYMGLDRENRPGLVLLEDDLIFELHDTFVYVTNLFNRTVPLIRYRMDDTLRPVEGPERFHGPYRVVSEVVGRSEEMCWFNNAEGQRDFIHPIVLVEFYVRHVDAFQVVLVSETAFRFRVVLEKGLDEATQRAAIEETRARLRQLLEQKRLGNVEFEVVEVDELRHDPKTGKFRLVTRA